MIYLLYLFLLATSDLILPYFSYEVLINKKIKIQYYVLVPLIVGIIFLRYFFNFNYIIIDILVFLYLFLFIQKKENIKFYYIIAFFLVTNLILMPMVNLIYFYLFHGYMNYTFSFSFFFANKNIEFICKIIYIIFLFYLQSKKVKNEDVFPKKYFNYLYALIISCFFTIVIFMIFSYESNNDKYTIIYSLLSSVVILILYIFNYFFTSLFQSANDNHNLILEKERNRVEINALLENQKVIEEVKKFKHDIQNNFVIIKHLIQEEQYKSATEYLNRYIESFEEINKYIQVDNLIVSAILNDKIRKYPSISFKIDCFIPKQLRIDDLDIGTILGNLIDNACEYYESNGILDTINLKILTHFDSGLYIEVKNSYLDETLSDDGLISKKHEKEYHGYGIINVRDIVNKYDGILDIKVIDKMFIVKILIPEGVNKLD